MVSAAGGAQDRRESGWRVQWEIDGKASGWAFQSSQPRQYTLSGAGCPAAHSGRGGGVTQGGIPVKKIAVRVAAFGGGIVAVLLAGGAWGRG